MNIFYVHTNPVYAAQHLCDSHVVKMILESCQMLSTAHRVLDGDDVDPSLYKIAHKNHPSTIWVRSSIDQYQWLYEHMRAMCAEYTKRYGKIHTCQTKLLDVLNKFPANIEDNGFIPPPLCMPEQYKSHLFGQCSMDEAVEAYRSFYVCEKAKFAKWKHGNMPQWFKDGYELEEMYAGRDIEILEGVA